MVSTSAQKAQFGAPTHRAATGRAPGGTSREEKRREEGPPHLEDAQPAAEALRIYRKMQQVDFNQQIRAPVTGRVIYIPIKLLSAPSVGSSPPALLEQAGNSRVCPLNTMWVTRERQNPHDFALISLPTTPIQQHKTVH